jgi:hypothetical protein
MRIKLAQIELLIAELNKQLERPSKPYMKENGKLTAQIGNFHLYQAYGAFGLHEMATDGGGIRETISLGTKKELYTALHKLIQGVELATA